MKKPFANKYDLTEIDKFLVKRNKPKKKLITLLNLYLLKKLNAY